MNKNESKYFNTAVKMDEALISLLEKKDFEYITVKEICEEAGVNRSTFYLHYENVSDLLKETARYILDKHFSYYGLEKRDMIDHLNEFDRSELVFITKKYLEPYLTFIKDNRRIFRIAIKRFDILNMKSVYDQMFKYIFEPILARFHVPEEVRVYVIKFYLSGVYAIVSEWLERDCADSIDSIIKIIDDCVMGPRNITNV